MCFETGIQVHLFCSAMKFSSLVKHNNYNNHLTSFENPEQDEIRKGYKTEISVFTVEEAPLHYKNKRGYYGSYPGTTLLTHLSVAELAVHFWNIDTIWEPPLKNIKLQSSWIVSFCLTRHIL